MKKPTKILNFQSLAPQSNIDNSSKEVLFDAIDFALRDDSITNIAITGPYGSGKSSLIKAYEKESGKNSFLNISLATIFTVSSESNGNNSNDKTGRCIGLDKIEYSILQQIFYSRSKSKLPFSRFKRIKNISKVYSMFISIYITCIFLFFTTYKTPNFFKFLNNIISVKYTNSWIDIFLCIYDNFPLVFLSLGIVVIFYDLIRLLGSLNISRIGVKDTNIDFSPDHASLLNKHIDEILYFFEVTDYSEVVIEDLDRCNSPDIFIKLRELNKTINDYEKIERKIKFIYVIKDSLFVEGSRTKFFDFIIPVIPIINNSNSGDMIIKLKNDKYGNSLELIDNDLLVDVGLYIDDMRILLNSINEYIIYSKQQDKLDKNKLFSIVLYKNLNPIDFEKMHKNNGLINQVFSKKNKIIKEYSKNIEEQITILDELLKKSKEERIDDIKDLRRIYLSKFFELNPNYSQHNLRDLVENDNTFNQCIVSKKINVISPHNQPRRQQVEFNITSIGEHINKNRTFEERHQDIINKNNKEMEKILKKRREKQIELDKIKNSTLKELYLKDEETFRKLIGIDLIEQNKLLNFLLLKGYVDENFNEYITFFYEGQLSYNDRDYILSIKNHNRLPYDYPLDNPKNIIEKKIRTDEWVQEEILNNDLFFFLLNSAIHFSRFKKFLNVMKNQVGYEFFLQLEISKSDQIKLFKELFKSWDQLCDVIIKKVAVEDRIISFLITILENCDISENQINLEAMKNYLEQQYSLAGFIALELTPFVVENMRKMELKFGEINSYIDNTKLFEIIMDNNLFEINRKMIFQIVLYYNNINTDYDFGDVYTKLVSFDNISLIQYINSNLNEFITNVIFYEQDIQIRENEEYIIAILNNESVDLKLKEKIGNQYIYSITSIRDINKISLWPIFYIRGKVKAQWDNLFALYESELKDERIPVLASFIYKNWTAFDQNDTEVKEKISILKEIFMKIIYCNNIEKITFLEICKICPVKEPSINVERLSDFQTRIPLLIKYGILLFNDENFRILKSLNESFHLDLMIKNFDSTIFVFLKTNRLNSKDLIYILKSSEISSEFKTKLISENIDIFEKNISGNEDEISKVIVENNYEEDLGLLLSKLFANITIITIRLKIIILQEKYIDDMKIAEYITSLNAVYNKLIVKSRAKSILHNTQDNRKLMSILDKRNLISSFKIDKSEIIVRNKAKL